MVRERMKNLVGLVSEIYFPLVDPEGSARFYQTQILLYYRELYNFKNCWTTRKFRQLRERPKNTYQISSFGNYLFISTNLFSLCAMFFFWLDVIAIARYFSGWKLNEPFSIIPFFLLWKGLRFLGIFFCENQMETKVKKCTCSGFFPVEGIFPETRKMFHSTIMEESECCQTALKFADVVLWAENVRWDFIACISIGCNTQESSHDATRVLEVEVFEKLWHI